jgi:hypothetical protein
MVMEKRLNDNHVFWEALLVALFVFAFGFLMGIFIENSRSSDIDSLYFSSETNLLDSQMLSKLIETSNVSCDYKIQKNVEFANAIYAEAIKLEEYEAANRLTDALEAQHKRYDLLRLQFWMNSVNLKKSCGGFHTIAYLYNYNNKTLEQKQEQQVFSRFLSELKNSYDGQVFLIPMAKDIGISSLDLMIQSYNITESETAVIIIDEKDVYSDIANLSQIKF